MASPHDVWGDLAPEARALVGPLREFLAAEVRPGAAQRDADGVFPSELVARLADFGLFGLQIPERYGGSGLDTTTTVRIIEELGAADGSLCLTVASHTSLCCGHILGEGDAG
jgi:alkylation response protein AidB-like acyl-CoA dehydrogenase